jgi:hypothetical protein
LAHAGEGHHGSLWIVTGVVGCPGLLIEGLDDVMVLGQGLAYAVAKNQFAIGQVAKDFVRAPLSGCRLFFYTSRTKGNG